MQWEEEERQKPFRKVRGMQFDTPSVDTVTNKLDKILKIQQENQMKWQQPIESRIEKMAADVFRQSNAAVPRAALGGQATPDEWLQ